MMQDAYIIAGSRSAVGKATKGTLRDVRPDDLAAQVIRHLVASLPEFDPNLIHDVIVGNASPEAEQGLNVGRLVSLMGLDTEKVPGMTVNRYCSSGLETIAIATAKIRTGMQELIIAGGTESMSCMPMGGWRIVPNARVAQENPEWYWGMGLTAEAVANDFSVSREAQDAFAVRSHERAAAAIDSGRLQAGVAPIEFTRVDLDGDGKRRETAVRFDTDEGVRRGTSMEGLAKLRPVFAAGGSVTAGNSSQTSDGAAFVMVASERMVKELGVEPIARLKSYHVAALEPRIMGMGPVHAVPPALDKAGLKKDDIDLWELNEAFASQSVAVCNELGLDEDKVNVNGGAIALGHPLGCTGAKLTVQILNELKARGGKHGVVTMCVGTGQGAAGVIEML